MKKNVLIVVFVLLIVFLAACSTRQNETNVPSSRPEPPVSSSKPQESSPDHQTEPEPAKTEETDSPLVKAVQGIIEQYKNGTVDTETGVPGSPGPTFDPLPEDFEFPEITSEADFEAIKEIQGSDKAIVYITDTGESPYMNIRIDTGNGYKVQSVLFMFSLPE